MRIDQYAVNLQGSSTQKSFHAVKEDLKVWLTEPTVPQAPAEPLKEPVQSLPLKNVEEADESDLFELSDKDKLKIKMIEDFIQLLTGKKFKFKIPNLNKSPNGTPNYHTYNQKGQGVPQSAPAPSFGLIYNREEQKVITSTVDFSASGIVKTQDGREIAFQSTFHVDQTLIDSSQFQLRMGAALQDPLVINFEGSVPEFGNTTFEFDLLSDGNAHQIKAFSSDTAYLAIDQNNNGKIDDGSELFGPKTNNGFAELSAYDDDQNGWIDENDAVFNNLKLWFKGDDGMDTLVGIANRDVGAIYLGHVATGLDLYSSTNQAGRLRDSGLVVTETGRTHTIQEIDLVL